MTEKQGPPNWRTWNGAVLDAGQRSVTTTAVDKLSVDKGATEVNRIATRDTVTIYVPDGYANADEFLRDCQFERAEHLTDEPQEATEPTKPFELTPLMLRLLKQAWSDGHIYPSDYMDRRLEEMTALREMAKHGFVHASEEDPRLPGSPAPPRWFITDKGLEAAAQPQVAPTQPFYGARCAAYPNCSGGCGCGCTHEIGDVEARIAVLSDALKRISKNTCCDNCQEAARVARSALGAYVGLARQPEPLSRSSADNGEPSMEDLRRTNVELMAKLKEAHQNNLALWQAVAGGPEPRCRDCADFNGRCQGNGLPCDPQERALERVKLLRDVPQTLPPRDDVQQAITNLVNDGKIGFLSVRHAYVVADAILALSRPVLGGDK